MLRDFQFAAEITHPGFFGNVSFAPMQASGDFVGDEWGIYHGALDSHGHGTHLAGIVGSLEFGVAPGVKIVSLRVTDGMGKGGVSAVLEAIDWLNKNAEKPAVVLMSLNYGNDDSLRMAVSASIDNGLVYVAAAGSMYQDACSVAPGGAEGVITVGAITISDTQTNMSNWGGCVDIWAPGANIESLSLYGGKTNRTGTSMASAFVAGTVALILSDNPHFSPFEVKSRLLKTAVPNVVKLQSGTAARGTTDLLLQVP